MTPSGPFTLIGQSGEITVQVTARSSSQILLDLNGTSQVLAAFCGKFTLAGIVTLTNYALGSVSIGLNFVGP